MRTCTHAHTVCVSKTWKHTETLETKAFQCVVLLCQNLHFISDDCSHSAHIYRRILNRLMCIYTDEYKHHKIIYTRVVLQLKPCVFMHTCYSDCSSITTQGCFPPRGCVPCQCVSCRLPPPLAAPMSCFFDRRSETDSMICTPAQTCMATSIPMVWLENVLLGISMTVCLQFQV